MRLIDVKLVKDSFQDYVLMIILRLINTCEYCYRLNTCLIILTINKV